jgi:hypothetical protein
MTPTDNYPFRTLLRLSPDQARAVTEFRTLRQLPTESATLRTLLDLGLRAALVGSRTSSMLARTASPRLMERSRPSW